MEVSGSQEDLAGVIGIACRVPGASSPSELWKVLDEKPELRKKIPKDRFNVDALYHPITSTKGKTNAQYAYFMEGSAKAFDATFFKISRKEAEAMDPQQRIILEVVYEALENAGVSLSDIAGTATSVYCGSSTDDYSAVSTSDMADYPTYANTGTGPCIMANRVSYFFDLKGESMLINTACSSALVCLHLGSESIKTRCSDMSIIVGSSLLLEPRPFITMADFGMLSTDGYSRAFDKAGQGFVRGEGVCAVVLKRVRDAQADGDTVKAVIRGSYTNHDGSKSGLTVPSSDSQITLIRTAYERAGVRTQDTDFVEAHGTGTPVGDPIEATALRAVFGTTGRERPSYVGSVKTVIGHLEGAAGLIGAIKAVMCVERGFILGNKHLHDPRSEFLSDENNLRIPTKTIPWHRVDGPRRASVNSFGYGGSNAHCIIEEYLPISRLSAAKMDTTGVRSYLIPLSAHTPTAGALLVDKITRYLFANPDVCVPGVANTLSTRRTFHNYRACVLVKDRNEMLSKFSCLRSADDWTPTASAAPRLGFVFTGQGAQWAQMGLQLLCHVPHFGRILSKCQCVLDRLGIDAPVWSIKEELERSLEETKIGRGEYSQPICTAIQIGLVEVLATWNIVPGAVIGHSSGEIAAAFASGHLSLEEAMITAYYRGLYTSPAYQRRLKVPKGAMLAVGIPESLVQTALQPYGGKINIAAINSPSLVTVSGDAEAVEELSEVWNQQGIWNRRLAVDQAYHSHHMQIMSDIYLETLMSQCNFTKPPRAVIPMYSSVTGRLVRENEIGPHYWVQNMISPVRFQDAIIECLADGKLSHSLNALVEIGPHPALKRPSDEIMRKINSLVPYFSTLSRNKDDVSALLGTAGELFKLGCEVHLGSVLELEHCRESSQSTPPPRLENFPSYAWDHEVYWHQSRMTGATFHRPYQHPLLGVPTGESTTFCQVWRNFLRLRDLPWLSDHKVQNAIVFPASGYISIAVEAALRQMGNADEFEELVLDNVSIISPLVIPDDESGIETIFQLVRPHATPQVIERTAYTFCFSSFDRQTSNSKEHCTGQIHFLVGQGSPTVEALHCANEPSVGENLLENVMSKAELYERFRSLGLQYGRAFRLVEEITYQPGVAKAVVRHETAALYTMPQNRCFLHPAFFDATLHPLLAAIEGLLGAKPTNPSVPQSFGSIRLSKELFLKKPSEFAEYLDVIAHSKALGDSGYSADLIIAESGGKSLIKVQSLHLAFLDRSPSVTHSRKVFSTLRWLPAFSLLGNDSKDSPLTVTSALDAFCHEFPKANILLVCDRPHHFLRSVMGVMCSHSLAHRRFAKLTIPGFRGSMESIGLSEDFTLAIESDLPTTKTFELAIILNEYACDLSSLIRDNGWVLTAQVFAQRLQCSAAWLKHHFACQDFSFFRLVPRSCVSEDKRTLEIIHTKSQGTPRMVFHEELSGLFSPSVIDISSIDHSSRQRASFVVVISCLYTDMLWEDGPAEDNASSRNEFAAMKSILLSENKTILWLLRGATLSAERPQQAMILGMIRAARNENHSSKIITLDVSPSCDLRDAARYASTILSHSRAEDEFVLHGGTVQIPRLYLNENLNAYNNGSVQQDFVRLKWFSDVEFVLRPQVSTPQRLEYMSTHRNSLKGLQLEIQVHASSITPEDMVNSQHKSSTVDLGSDCAGIVTAKGGAVPDSAFRLGEKVYFWAQGYGTHKNIVRVSSSLCVRLAKEDDLATCASWYKELALARYAVFTRCRVAARDRVFVSCTTPSLVHLIVCMCEALNAPVTILASLLHEKTYWKSQYPNLSIVTKLDGSLQKQRSAKTLFDVIVHEIMVRDVDSFAGMLAPRGRFLGIQSSGEETLTTSPDIWPSAANVEVLNIANPSPQARAYAAQLIQSVPQFLRSNSNLNLRAPPFEMVSFADCNDAYDLAKRLQAVRKVVLTTEHGPNSVPVYTQRAEIWKGSLSQNKAYLLVGGFSGLGRALALWMVRKGARCLAFLSRSGKRPSAAQSIVEHLRRLGIEVHVYEGDVTNLQAVQNCIDDLPRPLGGVFHMAMLLKDNPLLTMSYKLLRTGTEPKVRGAINLCAAIGNRAIDFFICFSSTSAIIGPPGQANYTAGNCFMDALMRQRRLRGQPGTSLNIGMITDVGVVSGNRLLLSRMRAQGFDPLTIYDVYAQVEAAFEEASSLQTADASGFEAHQIISGAYATSAEIFSYNRSICQCLASILDNINSDSLQNPNSAEFGAIPFDASNKDTQTITPVELLLRLIASLTGLTMASISPSQPLTTYGIDSISGAEVRTKIRNATGTEIALFEILGGVTIETLAERITATTAEKKSSSESNFRGPSVASTPLSLRGANSTETKSHSEHYEERSLSAYQKIFFIDDRKKAYDRGPLLSIFDLRGAVRPDIVKSALLELIKRNEALRTYISEDTQTRKTTPFTHDTFVLTSNLWRYEDLSAQASSSRRSHAHLDTLRKWKFDPQAGLSVRVLLVKLGPLRYSLTFATHRLITDHNMPSEMFGQLTALYDCLTKDQDPNAIEASSIVRNGVTNDSTTDSTPSYDHLNFWVDYMSSVSHTPLYLPFSERKRAEFSRFECLPETISTIDLDRMARAAAKIGVNTEEFLLAAFMTQLPRETGTGNRFLYVKDRKEPATAAHTDLDFYHNLLPLKCSTLDVGTFEDFVSNIKRELDNSTKHHGTPLASIIEQLGDFGNTLFFRGSASMVYHLGRPAQSNIWQTKDFAACGRQTRHFPIVTDIQLYAEETPSKGLELTFCYRADMYHPDGPASFFEQFCNSLRDFIQDPRQPVETRLGDSFVDIRETDFKDSSLISVDGMSLISRKEADTAFTLG